MNVFNIGNGLFRQRTVLPMEHSKLFDNCGRFSLSPTLPNPAALGLAVRNADCRVVRGQRIE